MSCQQELLKKCSWEWEGSICAVHQKSELWCSCWGVDPGGRFAQQKKLFRVFWKAISEVRKKQDLLQYNMNNLFKRSSMSVCVQSRNCVTPSNRTPLVSFNLVLVSSNNNTVHGNWKLRFFLVHFSLAAGSLQRSTSNEGSSIQQRVKFKITIKIRWTMRRSNCKHTASYQNLRPTLLA